MLLLLFALPHLLPPLLPLLLLLLRWQHQLLPLLLCLPWLLLLLLLLRLQGWWRWLCGSCCEARSKRGSGRRGHCAPSPWQEGAAGAAGAGCVACASILVDQFTLGRLGDRNLYLRGRAVLQQPQAFQVLRVRVRLHS